MQGRKTGGRKKGTPKAENPVSCGQGRGKKKGLDILASPTDACDQSYWHGRFFGCQGFPPSRQRRKPFVPANDFGEVFDGKPQAFG